MPMRLTRRQFGSAAAAAVLTAAYGRPGWAQQPIVIKFSHVVADDTPKGKGSLKFKELVEKYTGGKVRIEVYANSQLYKDKEEVEALQLGAVQMLAPSTAKFAPLGVKEFEGLDLPFLFTDLAFWDNGFHMVSANKPLLEPNDFQGIKIRISGSKIADLYFRKLGAIPQ